MVLLILVVAVALLFDFTNGFHDTANVVASVISTRAASPRVAVAWASVLNFAGALISLKVATTILTGIFAIGSMSETMVFAGLAGAIAWNLLTWSQGLPSSSTHALIGSLVGAVLVAGGSHVHWHQVLTKVAIPAVVAPAIAAVLAGVAIVLIYAVVANRRPGPMNRLFRSGELVSGSALALAHGANDAQKTMGVIGIALVAHGSLSAKHPQVPLWVVLLSATAMGLGTWAGGWRIIRTVGSRIIKMDPAQGFVAQGAGAVVILGSSALGYPLSSTQVITAGVIGAGTGKSTSAVRWGVASNIAIGWALTLPLSGLLGALAYGICDIFGEGLAGPVVVVAAALVATVAIVAVRRRAILVPAPGATGSAGAA